MARRQLSRRETYLLTGLAVVVLVFGYMRLFRDGGAAGRAGVDEAEAALSGEAPVVQMALLTREPRTYDPDGRDLFKYAKRPETLAERLARERAEAERLRRLQEEAERKRLAEEARAKQQEQQAQLARNTPPRPTGPVPPRARFSYLGYLGPKEDRIAVFASGEELLLARIGETVEDQFKVKEIKYQKVVLGFTAEEFKNQTTELTMKTK